MDMQFGHIPLRSPSDNEIMIQVHVGVGVCTSTLQLTADLGVFYWSTFGVDSWTHRLRSEWSACRWTWTWKHSTHHHGKPGYYIIGEAYQSYTQC